MGGRAIAVVIAVVIVIVNVIVRRTTGNCTVPAGGPAGGSDSDDSDAGLPDADGSDTDHCLRRTRYPDVDNRRSLGCMARSGRTASPKVG